MEIIKAYSKYKPSGIAWLGDLPENWEIRKLKYIFTITKRIAGELGYKVLAITQNGIKIKDTESGAGQLSMDYSKYQFVKIGDFAMNHMDLITGYVDISNFDGVTSPDYRVFISKNDSFNKSYLLLLLQLGYKLKLFYSLGQGVSLFGRWRLPAESFNHFHFPIPSLTEQTTIANFINYKTAKIDRFIFKKKQFIKLLNEQKAGIINDAVTKGLNPNAKMKPSGIEWLGDIPQHWEVIKLRFLCKMNTGNKNTEDRVDNGEYDFYVRSQKIAKINSYSFDGEGILTAGDGVGVGRVFHYVNGKFDYHQRVYLFYDFSNKINGKFLFMFLKTYLKIDLMLYNSKATVDSVRMPILKNFSVSVPPLQEQTAIVSHIEKETTTINKTISTIEKEIALVQEYRTAIIAEAVTGKIDVRDYKLGVMNDEIEEELNLAAEDEAEYEQQEQAS